ncbi:MAG TPA: hypothetical protein V6C65_14805 [Allocoleopsis sp.]
MALPKTLLVILQGLQKQQQTDVAELEDQAKHHLLNSTTIALNASDRQ